MDTTKRTVGTATMDDAAMEQASRDAIAAAERAQKEAAGGSAGPTTKVRVRTSRSHYRAGKFWPAMDEHEKPAVTIEDVSSDKLHLLLEDTELLVELLPAEPAAEAKPKK